ncbi:hypothetical protein [Bradyrhizobium sp. ORS 86]|uniref:hypothetical protein n=1 Tax=Bradyrhizobium sp. ORS 86 TaxID=1685970 RepID=UPI00388FF25F
MQQRISSRFNKATPESDGFALATCGSGDVAAPNQSQSPDARALVVMASVGSPITFYSANRVVKWNYR